MANRQQALQLARHAEYVPDKCGENFSVNDTDKKQMDRRSEIFHNFGHWDIES